MSLDVKLHSLVTLCFLQQKTIADCIAFKDVILRLCSTSSGNRMSTFTYCNNCPGPKVIKLFSSSAQLSMKFQLLINVEMIKISGKFRFKTQKLVIYPANKC